MPLHEFYPGARFLHLHRDGPEAALSMREHPVYRLWVAMMYGGAMIDPAHPPEPGPAGEDPVRDLLETRPAVELFGRYWTDLIARGFRAIGGLDRDQYMAVPFEDLVAEPVDSLRRVADFFELDSRPRDWAERAAGLVRGIPPTRFDGLADDERERLAESCRIGQQLLGRAE